MKKSSTKATLSFDSDRPIPFAVVDLDAPIPYRVRIGRPSLETQTYVVPRHNVPTFSAPPLPAEEPSGPRLKVA